MSTEIPEPLSVIEDTPDGPMLVVGTIRPLGKVYAILVPYAPLYVELSGDDMLPVPDADIPLLEAYRQQLA